MNNTKESINKSVKNTEEVMKNIRHDPYLFEETSWKKAFGISGGIHLLLIVIVAICLISVAQEQKKETYVIDMSISDTLKSGGSAVGGGGGGGPLFPKALSKEQVSNRIKEVQKEAANPNAVSQKVAAHEATSDAQQGANTGDSAGSQNNGGGKGSGSGGGEGSGIGSGKGEGVGPGKGQGGSGGGTGQGQGEGDAPFDVGGYIARVQSMAQDTYPPLAVRKHLEGTVTLQVSFDANGNCEGVAVVGSSGSSILDNHAVKKARQACPYPNDSHRPQTINFPVHFNLQ